jgi:hypothetical protein
MITTLVNAIKYERCDKGYKSVDMLKETPITSMASSKKQLNGDANYLP